MLISRMKPNECAELVSRAGFGRLGCARDGQPYIVPIYFAYEQDCLYGFATFGRKVEWMRSNPSVCVQADEIYAPDDWASVVLLGHYEELPDDAAHAGRRKQAQSLLEKRSSWWQAGYVAAQVRGRPNPPMPVLYCIRVQEMSGLRAAPGESDNSQIFWEE